MAEEMKSFITWVAPLTWFDNVVEPGKEVLFGWKIDELQDYSNVVACVVERGYYVYPDSFWEAEIYRGKPKDIHSVTSSGEKMDFYVVPDLLPLMSQVPEEYIREDSAYGTSVHINHRVKLVYQDGESDWKEGWKQKIYTSNSPPTTPFSMDVISAARAGDDYAAYWSPSTDVDDNLEGYEVEISVDGGDWNQVYKGAGEKGEHFISCTFTTPTKGTTFEWRVRAYDSMGATSDYNSAGNSITIIYNTPPSISGSDQELGQFSTSFTQKYTVTDVEGGSLAIVESVDGSTLNSFSDTLTGNVGKEYTVTFTAEQWARIGNGGHVLSLKAKDSYGESAERNYTFSKLETEIHLQYLEPLETENPVVLGILTVDKFIAEGASCSVEVCNNALDKSPTWENVTSSVSLGGRFYLNNDVKTGQKWAFNVRVRVKRETAAEDSWISQVSGYFREG